MLVNAYYCCKCLFGPMLLELFPACTECGAPACSSCHFTSLGEPNDPDLQQGPSEEATENANADSKSATSEQSTLRTTKGRTSKPAASKNPTGVNSTKRRFESAGTKDMTPDDFVNLLCEDESLQSILRESMHLKGIETAMVDKTVQKYLEAYSHELDDEAGNSVQKYAADLVQRDSTAIVQLLRVRCSPTAMEDQGRLEVHDPRSAGLRLPNHASHKGKGRSSGPAKTVDLSLASMREFILDSTAFGKLKIKLREFISALIWTQIEAIAQKELTEEIDVHVNVTHNDNIVQRLRRALIELGIIERPLREGKQRVRWKCRCGKESYDDYEELADGAVQELCRRLEHMSSTVEVDPGTNQGSRPLSSRLSFSTMMNGLSNLFGTKNHREQCLPQHNEGRVEVMQSSRATSPPHQTLHLLLCMRDGMPAPSLYQEEVSRLENDQQLFQLLRDSYGCHCRKLRSWISFRAPESVNLVKFRLVFGKTVDVPRPSSYCSLSRGCACLPPISKVEPEPSAEYRCSPVPPRLCPPIGPEVLLHAFTSPECIPEDAQSWILTQFPKKLHGQLAGDSNGPVEGWGVHVKEGWDWRKIRWLLLMYLLGSLTFGIAWTAGLGDIQGGFGVASYLVAALTVFIGYLALDNL